MQKLSANPGVRDVKAPSAMTRSLGTNKESFLIELELTPAAMQVAAASRAASAAAGANVSARKASSP
jgi:general secretion pathway protein L